MELREQHEELGLRPERRRVAAGAAHRDERGAAGARVVGRRVERDALRTPAQIPLFRTISESATFSFDIFSRLAASSSGPLHSFQLR